ncbi:MAG: hypothetical protein IKH45_07495 [Neisseriaceae bacterium]|nr:hypothetical protein [Neisseriaceae bacterium]
MITFHGKKNFRTGVLVKQARPCNSTITTTLDDKRKKLPAAWAFGVGFRLPEI